MGVLGRNMRNDVGQPLGNAPSADCRRQMDMFEDECQRVSRRRHGAIARGVAKRGLVAFLAFAMAFGTTPAQLWAEGAEGIAEAVAQAATGGEGAAADDGTVAADTGANGAPASAAADGADADQGATASAANGADTAADNATESESSAAMPAASEQKNAVAAASATTLSGDAKVYIQDAKDMDNSYSTKYGALSAGDTLWANMYDEVEDDWYGTSTESVANPGTWTYTWLAGTVRASSNVADYTEVVGHEQSLTVTAAMEGKYFICKVTVDGKDYYGPAAYGSGINANYIPGPVLGAGQMELYSVKLNSDTPSIGDTLTATSYKDWSSPAGSDAKVTYTWSASTSQSSGFTKIEGATGASLTVTDDLEGKYIKVEATAGVNTVSKTTSSKVKQAGAVEISAVSIINTKDNTSVFAVGIPLRPAPRRRAARTAHSSTRASSTISGSALTPRVARIPTLRAPRVRPSSLPTLWAASTSSARCLRRSALRA